MVKEAKSVLVVGGAGYIGSHMVLHLKRAGFQPIVLDNLSRGHRQAVKQASLVVGDMADAALLHHLFEQYPISAVMHFASYIDVNESIREPLKYYQNNLSATLTLLDVMLKHDIKDFIFSSTAAVYGDVGGSLISETHPLAPISAYGRSKLMVETVIQDLAKNQGLRYAILRYFNAAGRDPESELGECHEPETHLIPLLLQVAAARREAITVYGNDYPTIDGTCVRDYVHVNDICQAHLQALQLLLDKHESIICNLGAGQGHSVLQVIDSVERVTGKKIPVTQGDKRAGDPAKLVADTTLARKILQWVPNFSDLDTMIEHAWATLRC